VGGVIKLPVVPAYFLEERESNIVLKSVLCRDITLSIFVAYDPSLHF
jgi:hypothetical protein